MNRLLLHLGALGGADAAVMALAACGLIKVSPLSASMLNLAIVLYLRRGKAGRLVVEMKSLPAIAAAGTIVVQVTGSKFKLIELLSTSSVGKLRTAFLGALSSCYRGEPIGEALERASTSLPFQGMRSGLRGLDEGRTLETVSGQAAFSGLDLDRYYTKAIGTLETRVSLLQGVAFFLPLMALIVFPRFLSGQFDAVALTALATSSLRYISRVTEP
jgi:hypothetical protein